MKNGKRTVITWLAIIVLSVDLWTLLIYGTLYLIHILYNILFQ
jgi:hypothetical protein